MDRVNLAKYGFVRTPEDDFSDDGTRFQVYRAGRYIRVSKASWLDEIFLAARLNGNLKGLTYQEECKLPHYRSLSRLNGVSKLHLTDADLKQFYDDCIAFEKEYEEAVSNIVYPSETELFKAFERIRDVREHEFNVVDKLIYEQGNKLINLDMTDFAAFKRNYERLIQAKNDFVNESCADKARAMSGTYESRNFIQNLESRLSPSWSYQDCLKILEKAGIE
jgi:hypothetical protein